MDNQPSSTLQGNGSQLSRLFGQNTGYQQMPAAPIAQPQSQLPMVGQTPQQAAAATMARMQARTPMMAPMSAPRTNSALDAANRQVIQQNLGLSGRGNR